MNLPRSLSLSPRLNLLASHAHSPWLCCLESSEHRNGARLPRDRWARQSQNEIFYPDFFLQNTLRQMVATKCRSTNASRSGRWHRHGRGNVAREHSPATGFAGVSHGPTAVRVRHGMAARAFGTRCTCIADACIPSAAVDAARASFADHGDARHRRRPAAADVSPRVTDEAAFPALAGYGPATARACAGRAASTAST